MSAVPFGFTPAEPVALQTIAEERPEVLAILSEQLARVIDPLCRTTPGRVVTEAGAERLLLRLRDEFAGRMLAEMELWGEDGDLREPVVELLARHFLAETQTSRERSGWRA